MPANITYIECNGAAVQAEITGQIIRQLPVEGSPNQQIVLVTPHAILNVLTDGGLEALYVEPYTGPDLNELETQYNIRRTHHPVHDNHIDN